MKRGNTADPESPAQSVIMWWERRGKARGGEGVREVERAAEGDSEDGEGSGGVGGRRR